MDIKYNDVIGAFVNTANDEPVTQAELLAWAAENPLPIDAPKKSKSDATAVIFILFIDPLTTIIPHSRPVFFLALFNLSL